MKKLAPAVSLWLAMALRAGREASNGWPAPSVVLRTTSSQAPENGTLWDDARLAVEPAGE